jgi:hypothetical protein
METIRVYGANCFTLPGIGYEISGAASTVVGTTSTTATFSSANPTAIVSKGGISWAYVREPINTSTSTIGDSITLGPAPLLSVIGASLAPASETGSFTAVALGDTTVITSDGTLTVHHIIPPPAPPTILDLLVVDGARLSVSYTVPQGAAAVSIAPEDAKITVESGQVQLAAWGNSDPETPATEVVADLGVVVVRFIKRSIQCVIPAGVALPIASTEDLPVDTQIYAISQDGASIVFKPSATAAPQLSIGGGIEYNILAIAASSIDEVYNPQMMVGVAFVNYQSYDAATVSSLTPGSYTLSYEDGTVVYTNIVGAAGDKAPIDLYYFGSDAYPPQLSNTEYVANIRAAVIQWEDPDDDAAGITPVAGVLQVTPPEQDAGSSGNAGIGVSRFNVTYDGEFQFSVPPDHVFAVVGGSGSVNSNGLLTASGNVTVNETDGAGRIVSVYSLQLVPAYTIENLTLEDGETYVIGGVKTFLSGLETYFTYNATAQTITVAGNAPAGLLVKYVSTDDVRYAALLVRIAIPPNHIATVNTYIGEDVIIPSGLTAPADASVTDKGDGTYAFSAAGTFVFSGTPISYKVVVSSKNDVLRLPAVLGTTWSYTFSKPVSVLSANVNGTSVPTSTFDLSTNGLTLSIPGASLVVGTTSAILADGRSLIIDATGPSGGAISKYTHDYLIMGEADTLANYGDIQEYLSDEGQGLFECLKMTTASIPLQVQNALTNATTIQMLDIIPRTARLGACSMLTDGGTRHFVSNTVSSHASLQTNPQNAFRLRPWSGPYGAPGMLGNNVSVLIWERISLVWDGPQGDNGVTVNLQLRDSFGNTATKSFAPYIACHIYQFVIGTFSTYGTTFPAEVLGTDYNGTDGPFFYLNYEDAGFLTKDMNLTSLQDLPMGDTAMIGSSSYTQINAPVWWPDGTPLIREGHTAQETFKGLGFQIICLF